jgi:DNA ligase-1
MKQFAALFRAIDQTTKTNSKVAALADYFLQASDRDKIWTIALLSHRRPRRTITTTFLRSWAAEKAGLPLWLFEESYHIAGDLAETIALVLPVNEEQSEEPLSYWIEEIQRHRDRTEEEKKEFVFHAWNHLDATERFVFNKLITGGFRMGVSQKLMTRALSKAYDMDENRLAHRLMGNWTPNDTTFEELILTEDPTEDLSRPYPFYLAYALEETPEDLGKADEWSAEWKWDGIRAQWIQRGGEVFLWSRGEELVTDKYPELNQAWSPKKIDVVIDGELLPFQDGHPLSFNALQKRIGRKTVSKKLLKEVPVIIRAYDLLEWKGEDLRSAAFRQRRIQLQQWMESLPPEAPFMLSEEVPFENWQELAEKREKSRTLGSEGLMLKKWDSPYLSGRKKGDWWKWKVDPFTIDAVMIYAQQGHGRRSNLFTDYTFAVWSEKGELIPFTKAYSGLKDTEFREITSFVKKNTLERYGPVRAVKPELVFEVAFEGIARSSRHKSGVALRFPRMKRWRKDKPAQEANTLEDLYQLLRKYEEGGRPEA